MVIYNPMPSMFDPIATNKFMSHEEHQEWLRCYEENRARLIRQGVLKDERKEASND